MKNLLIGATAALALLAAPAMAKDTLKIGMIVTLSGPPGALGNQARDGFKLAMDKLDGKIGGMETEFILEDDELKADVAQSKAKSLVEKEEVDFVVGTIFSNMLAAIYKPVIKSDTFLISPNAGPSTFAGKNCNPNFFVTSYQNNQNFEVLGKIATDKKYKKVFMLAPNYQAGKDSMAGFKQNYKGEIADEVYTPLGHKDFSAEIARMSEADADALFIFMPGGMGVRFVKQFRASGLADKMAFLSAFTVDETTLPGQKDDAVGMNGATNWAPDLDNAQTKAFVAAFEEEYGYIPGGYAMQAYDTAMLINSAVKKAGGVKDKDAVREALAAADFESLRGDFSFNNNQFPIQDFYQLEVVKRDDGKFHTSIVEKVYDDYSDSYADQCKM